MAAADMASISTPVGATVAALAVMAVCTMPLAAAIFRFCLPAYRQVARNGAAGA